MNLPLLGRALLLLLTCVFASAQDVTFYGLLKQQRYEQLTPGAPTPRSQPYRFNASVNTQPGGLASGSLKLPGGVVQALPADGNDSWRIRADYLTLAGLDGDFPNGTYTLTLNTTHDGTKIINLPLTGNAYPNVPQILNFSAAQSVNPTAAFTVSWSAFAGGTVNDYVQLVIDTADGNELFKTGSPGQPGSLNGTATSATIPAGLLAPDKSYTVQVFFGRFVTVDSTTYGQGVMGVSAYTSETRCTLKTTSTVTGPDVSLIGVVKGQELSQTGPGTAVLQSDLPFRFYTFVSLTDDGTATAASLQRLPDGAVIPLDDESDEFGHHASFAMLAALDTAFPSGDYRVTVDSNAATLTLAGDAYPNAPRCSNFNAAQAVNPAASFTLTWDAFAGGTATDFIQVQVETTGPNGDDTAFFTREPGHPDALNGTATSVTIPAGTLTSGAVYSVRLLFANLTTFSPVGFPSATSFTGHYKATEFSMKTQGTADVTPPSLTGSIPANGAINVPVNSSIAFTFSEPMQEPFSISWSGNDTAINRTFVWSADHRTLTVSHEGGLPTNKLLGWVLNPSGFGDSFRDLAGNFLPADIAGSFSTASVTATDPTITIERMSEFQWRLHANGAIGQNYLIEGTDSLAPPVNWQPIVNFIGSANGFDSTDGVVHSRHFYRVRPAN